MTTVGPAGTLECTAAAAVMTLYDGSTMTLSYTAGDGKE